MQFIAYLTVKSSPLPRSPFLSEGHLGLFSSTITVRESVDTAAARPINVRAEYGAVRRIRGTHGSANHVPRITSQMLRMGLDGPGSSIATCRYLPQEL